MRPIQIKNNITYSTVEKHLKRVNADEEKERKERYMAQSPCYLKQFSVRFYEWSNTNSTPRVFHTSFAFIEFLKQCNISFTDAQRNMIYSVPSVVYATCKKNEASLLVASTMAGLKLLMETTSSQSTANLPTVINNGN